MSHPSSILCKKHLALGSCRRSRYWVRCRGMVSRTALNRCPGQCLLAMAIKSHGRALAMPCQGGEQ